MSKLKITMICATTVLCFAYLTELEPVGIMGVDSMPVFWGGCYDCGSPSVHCADFSPCSGKDGDPSGCLIINERDMVEPGTKYVEGWDSALMFDWDKCADLYTCLYVQGTSTCERDTSSDVYWYLQCKEMP